ncbi:MAG TPA: hypothetical protein VIF32_10270 [Gemmatimonadaceae bacterium]
MIDLSDLAGPQRRFRTSAPVLIGNMLNLAHAATKDYQGPNEKIAPVSVKSLTA